LAGDAVFLCGTGISAPQLPTFKELVDKVSNGLGEPFDASEQLAYEQARYEEVLGSLARRMANPQAMVEAASAILAVPQEPMLAQHRTVLRLSRDLANRILVVTTNFDTLLERAVRDGDGQMDVTGISFAGQALPAPGGANFGGIIHLHGRLEDGALSLEATPLVLTSADYGDAYMRGGWASRFLFDLARCKTIVLLGYSAGDAPVRYFLNVLEADRTRFPSLKPVYAFADYVADASDAERPWGTVAVTPIAYSRVDPATGAENHSPLWRDLAQLAEVAERPKHARDGRLRAILSRPRTELTDDVLGELRWLMSGGADPWAIVIETVEDPRWFVVFQDNALWEARDAAWVVAAWAALRLEDRTRFMAAVEWNLRLGSSFQEHLKRRLRQATAMAPGWLKAWRLLCHARTESAKTLNEQAYTLIQQLGSGLILEQDLVLAVEELAPVLTLQTPFRLAMEEDDTDGERDEAYAAAVAKAPERLADLVRVDIDALGHHEASELTNALNALDAQAPRILALASNRLLSAVATAVDLDLVHGDQDVSDHMVPSVEPHQQNENHSGVLVLVQLIVTSFGKVAAAEPEEARRIAGLWRSIPGRIGIRLTLHAMRDARVFDADEAMKYLHNLDENPFWNIRREVAMLLADRAAEANANLVFDVEKRILESGADFFLRYDIQKGQSDWRAYARDNDVWLRLSQLQTVGRLSAEGATELAAIKARRPHLDRLPEDSDYFSSYSSGVRQVVGDMASITSATPDDRLNIVLQQADSSDIEQRQGWGTYCRTDPRGAYATIAEAPLSPANLELWGTLLSALSFGEERNKAIRDEVAVDAVAKLAGLALEELKRVAAALVDVFYFGPRAQLEGRESWYDRLWTALCLDERELTTIGDLSSAALNAPAGRLAQVLLQELEASRAAGNENVPKQLLRLTRMAGEPRRAGSYARVVFVKSIAFLLTAVPALVNDVLVPRFGDDREGPALRGILVRYSSITPEVTRAIPTILMQAIREAKPSADSARPIAALILRPALAVLRGEAEPQWGITFDEARQLLRDVPAAIRKAALDVLVRWLHAEDAGPAQTWLSMVRPFLEQVWPKGRHFVDSGYNILFAELAIGSGAHFPAALELVRHYIAPFSGRGMNVHSVNGSTAPANFPHVTLDLLWLLFGPTGPVSYDVPELLQKLIAADPAIEVDRRLQSLEQRSQRF
jgi:hypothetical protein